MAIAEARLIVPTVLALMTLPIIFNMYSQKNNQIQVQPKSEGFSQPRKILETINEENECNETTSISRKETLDVTMGVLTKVLYVNGFLENQPKICPNHGDGKQLLIIVTSAPSHEKARNNIRNTWGKLAVNKNVSFGFLLGYTPNATVTRIIQNEQKSHGDIIQGKSFDSYDNLTLKTISALEWVDNYCSQVQFVLKTDDDVFINVNQLIDFVSNHDPNFKTIYGRVAKNWKPIRNQKSKYYTSTKQYESKVFPSFTTGPAYIFPASLSRKLLESALNKTYFKLEDVFTTGLVAEGLGIKRESDTRFLNKKISFTPCNLKRSISIHPLKENQQIRVWNLFKKKAECKR